MAANPILPLETFIPDVEAKVFTNAAGEQRLYLYGSCDSYPSETWCSHRYHVFSAPLCDLDHWTDHGVSFASRKGEGYRWNGADADGVSWSDRELYAPDVAFDGERYWLVGCLAGGGLTMSWSETPEGPFCPAKEICYEDGTPLGSIDPTLLFDDGTMYLVWGQTRAFAQGEGCVGVVLKKDRDGFYSIANSETKTLLMDGAGHNSDGFFFYEGPSLCRLDNGSYCIYYPSGNGQEVHAMAYATADHPLGPYTYRGIVLDPAGTDATPGNCHGSLCKISGQWYAFYHRGIGGDKSRRVCVEPITILEDGTIPQVPVTSRGFGGPLDPYAQTDASRASRVRLPGFTAGCRLDVCGDGRHPLIRIAGGSCVEYRDFDFGDNGAELWFEAETAPQQGGHLEIVLDDPTGPAVGVLELLPGDGTWEKTGVPVGEIHGIHTLYLRFTGGEEICQLASFMFCRKN